MIRQIFWAFYGVGCAALFVITLIAQLCGLDVMWLWCIASAWLLSIIWEVTARI